MTKDRFSFVACTITAGLMMISGIWVGALLGIPDRWLGWRYGFPAFVTAAFVWVLLSAWVAIAVGTHFGANRSTLRDK